MAHRILLVSDSYHCFWRVCCWFLSSAFKFNKRGATNIQECNVRTFDALIFHTLSGTNPKTWYTFLIHRVGNRDNFMEHILRTQDRNVQTKREHIYKQKNNHKTRFNTITNNCFVCRNYLHRNGMTQYNTTQWWRKLYKLPMCAVYGSKTSNNKAKTMSWFLEHIYLLFW